MVKKEPTLNFGTDNRTKLFSNTNLKEERQKITPPSLLNNTPKKEVNTNKVTKTITHDKNVKEEVLPTKKNKVESNKYSHLFDNAKKQEKLIDRNYTLSNNLINKIEDICKAQDLTKNTFIVELIKSGIEEEKILKDINIDTQVPISILRTKKVSYKIRLPKDYDDKLQAHKDNLCDKDKVISKSEILNILLYIMLNKIG